MSRQTDDINAALRRLREDNDRLVAEVGEQVALGRKWMEHADRLREALAKYGKHHRNCKLVPDTANARAMRPKGSAFVPVPCSCGLDAALAAAPATEHEAQLAESIREWRSNVMRSYVEKVDREIIEQGRTHYDVAHAVALKDAERKVVEAAKAQRDTWGGVAWLLCTQDTEDAVDALRALEQQP